VGCRDKVAQLVIVPTAKCIVASLLDSRVDQFMSYGLEFSKYCHVFFLLDRVDIPRPDALRTSARLGGRN